MRTATGLFGSIVALACLQLLQACASQERAPEGSSMSAVRMASSPELAAAVEDYREARYTQSFERSKSLARASNSPLREQAAWVAGLSAYQMQMLDEAELQFIASGRSQDPRLVVDSKIMIADVRVLQNRWPEAAQNYRDAAQGLSGEERSRVLGYADVASSYAASRAAGQVGTTGTSIGTSTSTSSSGSAVSSGSRSTSSEVSNAPVRRAGSAFALQAGAFQNETNARRRAAELAGQARQAGLGDPRVVRTRDAGGREFWAVQLGQFESRQNAEAAKSRLASVSLIVTNAG